MLFTIVYNPHCSSMQYCVIIGECEINVYNYKYLHNFTTDSLETQTASYIAIQVYFK